jgi:hypothetical protein
MVGDNKLTSLLTGEPSLLYAIEPDPHLRPIMGGPIYRITARGVQMLDETYPGELGHPPPPSTV